ncbi:APC family permease [Alloacidobacterium dinghuense]|uniref:APC family permease n=1 Tax=Alloacidobacterium dinghuense TaxID=2763107 RepID=A0A7G8BI89_9BACT|nr:APC family permease [Alloacidobacterium dinghuense]QNI32259.1 APC family permease [Alloacidobacterium dinghuense]
MPETPTPCALKRELGLFDLVLFYVAGGLSLRWIATAAAAGPSTIVVWIFACLCFFVPLAACVLELSSRYPEEGGLYVWTQRAFGDFSGFIAAWTYWMSNLPYFPAVLYFGAGSALFALGKRGEHLTNEPKYYMLFALSWLALITLLNIFGLRRVKWLNNCSTIGTWIPVVVLLGLGAIFASRYGSATSFAGAQLIPHADLKNAIFWSTIFFAFGGVETGSFMGEEIKDPRRTIPRSIVIAGALIVLCYVAGTIAMLIALPSSAITGVGGFVSAISLMCTKLSLGWLITPVALLVVFNSIGSATAYLSSTSRLPFVAGIDRYLPPVFGRVHPRWCTPWIAIGAYGLVGMLCALLSQAGTTVRSAYDVLVSMSIITYFIPFAFLFASMIRLQREPAPAGTILIPGGKPVAIVLASLGLLTTLLTIVLSVIPPDEEPNKPLAVMKVIGSTIFLVSAGVAIYYASNRRLRRATALYPVEKQ